MFVSDSVAVSSRGHSFWKPVPCAVASEYSFLGKLVYAWQVATARKISLPFHLDFDGAPRYPAAASLAKPVLTSEEESMRRNSLRVLVVTMLLWVAGAVHTSPGNPLPVPWPPSVLLAG